MENVPSNSGMAVRRPNETIAINPKKGKITLGTRRLFNLLLYFSQQDGIRETYSRSISEVMAHITTSKDSEWLKECFRQMQETSIEWNHKEENREEWGVSGLISEARIITAGNSTTIAWALPQIIRDRLMDPRFYTKLTLEIHSKLKTGASIALYEICSRYVTNPSKVTNREHWQWWQPRLTGNPKRETDEYKYFSRDVLRPAIAEVNQVSDVIVELIEHKNGRRIEELQFKIARKALSELEAEVDKPFDGNLLESIIRLGVSQKEARALYAAHNLVLLRKTVALTEQRANATNVTPLKSKAAFFKKALSGQYATAASAEPAVEARVKAEKVVQISQEQEKAQQDAKLAAKQIQDAYELWAEQGAEKQLVLLHTFREASEVEGYRKDIQRRGLACMVSIALRTAFCQWYANQTWGDSGADYHKEK
ncbi:replication initiation protein [Herbaspirillum sp. RTI4]|uniref:replication initiation protein n=1 Tax=Herbaspirillum sp. RTI4 TaxID=3048640 RepID=UPI002AB48353|nr:replication initiation protein [Herbaspirillum sp. RTI4]MDY7576742.1 replication initiation protein [Herbaspirillum sp. RTI4]MEA9983407.1 replication initiation protein [Herbaspirillum sp. RTI4]